MAGCSFPTLGASKAPVTTGSIPPPIEVQRPLPQTLAFSDATRIGEAARAALWQAEGGGPEEEWVNARTGSSGTLTARGGPSRADDCRPFSTTVTSLSGVHQYSGTICRPDSARMVMRLVEGNAEDGS